MEKTLQAKEMAGQAIGGTTQTAQEKGSLAMNIAMEKASQAKDMAAQTIGVTT